MRKRGPLGTEIAVQVPFYDVDSMAVVWHGHYAKYMEQARCALLEDIGYDYLAMRADGYVWPVIDLRIRYAQPTRFGQHLLVRIELVEWENRLVFNYLIRDAAAHTRLTRATTTQVAVRVATHEMLLVSPNELIAAVQAALNRRESRA